MNFRERSTEQELMDDPNLDLAALREVFLDINKVNKILNGHTITLKAIKKMMEDHPKNSYTIMDLGCGDGDMLRQIALYFKDRPETLNLIGVDLNGNAIKLATENSRAFANITFLQQDVLTLDNGVISCDILLCTLTMHHFGTAKISAFLNQVVRLPRIGAIINDLQRNKLSYYLYTIFSVIFIKTNIARYDGLVSIKRGFTKSELQDYAKGFPGMTHQISWKWAFRYLWTIQLKRQSISDEQN